MKTAGIITSALVLATTATAAPFTSKRRAANNQILSGRNVLGNPARTLGPLPVNANGTGDRVAFGKSSDIQYSSNWAGAVQISDSIVQVSGSVNVPSISGASGAGGSAWVGIDGDSCQNAILQTGIDWVIQDGEAQYAAWYEWLPEYSYNFDLAVNEGDDISFSVVASSNTSGTAYVTNRSTGKSVQHSFSGEQALCGENAEWILEDFEVNNNLIPFAQFSPVTFTDATWVAGGSTYGLSGSSILEIKQNGSVLTNVSTVSEESLQITYTS